MLSLTMLGAFALCIYLGPLVLAALVRSSQDVPPPKQTNDCAVEATRSDTHTSHHPTPHHTHTPAQILGLQLKCLHEVISLGHKTWPRELPWFRSLNW